MSIGRVVMLLLAGIGAGAGNFAALQSGQPLTEPPMLAVLLGTPVAVALIGWILGAVGVSTPTAEPTPEPTAEGPIADETPPTPKIAQETLDASALRLLATLQEDGRLIDFLTEEVAPYSDEQIGAATRAIHESLRKALQSCVTVEPVLTGTEGETITVPNGFDPAAIRLVGNVSGKPPFRGTLRHAGWRATLVQIPERRGQDDKVLAPAEVEIA